MKQVAAPEPVGFPREDAFSFDERLVAALQDASHKGDRKRLKRLWTEATPFAEVDSN